MEAHDADSTLAPFTDHPGRTLAGTGSILSDRRVGTLCGSQPFVLTATYVLSAALRPAPPIRTSHPLEALLRHPVPEAGRRG